MRKTIVLLFCGILLISACSNDDSKLKEKELELKEKELELKEKELELEKKSNTNISNSEFKTEKNDNKPNKKKTQTKPKEKTQKELKRELALKECETPTNYLKKTGEKLNGTYKNALSMKFNGFKVKFKLHNTASVVTFKNVKCRVTLSSYSGSVILSENFTVREYIPAGSYVYYSGEFSCTNQQFKDTDSYSLEILGAECH